MKGFALQWPREGPRTLQNGIKDQGVTTLFFEGVSFFSRTGKYNTSRISNYEGEQVIMKGGG